MMATELSETIHAVQTLSLSDIQQGDGKPEPSSDSESRCGVNRLPPEILRIIFLLLLRPTDFSPMLYSVGDFGWTHTHFQVADSITLSHVCQRWRAIALDFPYLWTSIRATHAKGTEELFRRADGLSIQLVVQGTIRGWLKDICAERGSSISELHWFSTPLESGVRDIIELPMDAPNVERLSLSRHAKDASRYRASRTVLQRATNNVRYLSLNNFDWLLANHFPAVTHVVLSGALEVHNLLNFLRNCPQLETLVMRDCSIYDPPPGPPTVQDHLPRLRRLSVHVGRFNTLAAGLRYVPYDRLNSTTEIIMDSRKVDPNMHFTGFYNMLGADAPMGLASSILQHPNYAAEPYTRLFFKQSTTDPTPRRCALALFSDRGGVAFRSLSPLDFDYVSLFGGPGELHAVTELWIDGVDKRIIQLYMIIHRDLPNLHTVNLVHPERAEAGPLGMFITNMRMSEMALTEAPRTVRLIFGSGRVDLDPDVDRGTRVVLGLVGALWPLGEKTSRLILRGTEFSPEYYSRLVPLMEQSWESVVTEVSDDAVPLPPQVQADVEFPPWEGW